MVTFGVLGPLTATCERGPIPLKGPRHRAVLARLLVARGRVVPVSWLVNDLWEEPGEGAVGAVQTFVGALRKALEPDRPPRTPSRLLVTSPPGYALRAEPDAVDAWRFESALAEAARVPAAEAYALLGAALGLWRGPAYAEFADQDWARGEAARLDELRLLAVERRAEAGLIAGPAAECVADLEAHVAAHPLREDGWRLLAHALYATGRQGDALATLRRARETLLAELGVDPGAALRTLEADILSQAPHLTVPRHPASPVELSGPDRLQAGAAVGEHPFVGREAELGELERAAADVVASGRARLALVSGAAGAGKTALVRTLARRLEATGWHTAWAAGQEAHATTWPWPWRPADAEAQESTRRHTPRVREASAEVAAAARRAPLLLAFDDLHEADEETLALLTTLATGLGRAPVLVVGTYRSTDLTVPLTEALGRAARAEPVRVYLGGLSEPETGALVRALATREPPGAHVRTIHARSGGNPFFVRELTRLWESCGDAALHTVPAGVRDVIRQRLAGLPEAARTHLRQAAVIGQEIDLDVLIALAGDEEAVLDSVESALLAGFLVERDAHRLRFAHALVHETLYADVARARRARRHAAVADIVERLRPGDVEAIAHHCLRSEGRAGDLRTARYARAAAERAERRFAPHEAARLWRAALEALGRAAERGEQGPSQEERLAAVMGLGRALAVIGRLGESRRLRAEAVDAAEALGDPLLTAAVIGSFDVPANWTANDDPALSARLVAAAERTLAALPGDETYAEERARLLITIAMERRADPGRRGDQAAREAERIARRLGDRTLLAYALNGRALQTFHRAGLAGERAAIGEELLRLAERAPTAAAARERSGTPEPAGAGEGMVTFTVLAHLILLQARAGLGDLAAADRHAAAADRLAEQHDLPLVGVFTGWYAALRLAITSGDSDEVRAAYRAAAARLDGSSMPGVEQGLLPLALLCLNIADAGPLAARPVKASQVPAAPAGEAAPGGAVHAEPGPYEAWVRPFTLLAAGRFDEAREAVRAVPESPRDLLYELRTCLHATAALAAGVHDHLPGLYDRLLPAHDELAGAGSGLVTLGPVAFHLGHLASALGMPERAREHFRQAAAVAGRAGAPHWATAATSAEQRIGR